VNPEELEPRDYLLHIVEAIDRVFRYTTGMSPEHFLENSLVQDAVICNIEIVGEAAKNLVEAAPDIPSRYGSIPECGTASPTVTSQ